MQTTKRKSRNKSMQLLKVKKGKYFIKIPNLDVPVQINKYLFERWSKMNGFCEVTTGAKN